MKKFVVIVLAAIGGLIVGLSLVSGVFWLMNTSQDSEFTSSTESLKVRGLKDCQLIALEVDNTKLYVIRCPQSGVSVRWTKDNKNYFVNTIEE